MPLKSGIETILHRKFINFSFKAQNISLKGNTQIVRNRLSYGLTVQSEKIDDKIAEWERRDSVSYSLPRDAGKLRVVENLHSAYKGTTTRLSAFV